MSFFFSFIKFTNGNFSKLTYEVKSNVQKEKNDSVIKANHSNGHYY